MSEIEGCTASVPIGATQVPRTAGMRVLVFDAPNIDMALSGMFGRKPTAQERPDMRALGAWLVQRSDPCDEVEATIFVNVPQQSAAGVQNWVKFLLCSGFRVFAKPKSNGSDVDADMLAYIEEQRQIGRLREVVVASHDARAFLAPLEALAAEGVRTTVIAFRESAGRLSTSSLVELIDLESIPSLFRAGAIPSRVNLESLPPDGRWFEPATSLRSVAQSEAVANPAA